MELTGRQQRRAVNFSVCFLRDEVHSLKEAMGMGGLLNNRMHEQAQRRLDELEKDLKEFEELNDKINL